MTKPIQNFGVKESLPMKLFKSATNAGTQVTIVMSRTTDKLFSEYKVRELVAKSSNPTGANWLRDLIPGLRSNQFQRKGSIQSPPMTFLSTISSSGAAPSL